MRAAMETVLKAPFPWFGGKSRAAHLVWPRFGDVPNYVEPFAGSLAVMLRRPTPARIETVNDLDCFVANFWRAVRLAPEETAEWADWPVNEADLHARHRWLVNRGGVSGANASGPGVFRCAGGGMVGVGDLPMDRERVVFSAGVDGEDERRTSCGGHSRGLRELRRLGEAPAPSPRWAGCARAPTPRAARGESAIARGSYGGSRKMPVTPTSSVQERPRRRSHSPHATRTRRRRA